MVTVGIDNIAFYTPHYFLDLKTLAEGRGVEVDKFYVGLGQRKMAVPPPDETIVTMAANAAEQVLKEVDLSTIHTLLFATESGIDQSKAAGIFVHELLGLSRQCRVVELKQACYSATAGLKLAMALIAANPKQKVLLIASDIARYGLNTAGESSQGGGAVAMLLSANPRVLAIEPESGLYTEDAMDFWRPNYREEALVEGKYSCDLYLKALKETWQDYQHNSGRQYADHQHFLYHIPIPRLAEKAHQKLAQVNDLGRLPAETLEAQTEASLRYSRAIGNCYTASLYLGLISLLEHLSNDCSGQRIGFYSYGSGCVAEFFSGVVQPGYQSQLHRDYHQQLLDRRTELSLSEYEAFYSYKTPTDGSAHSLPHHTKGRYRLAAFDQHKPSYQRIAQPRLTTLSAKAPGKLIIAGEHAVLHGSPALAMAVTRYTTTTITEESTQASVVFDLLNVEHKGAYTLDKLRSLKHRLQDAHGKFLRGERGIRDVIKKPFELLQFTATHMMDTLHPQGLEPGIKIHTDSNIPIGCGMGSSAASIVSTNFAMAEFFGHHLDSKKQLELSLAAESLQHGRSSGVDLHMAIHGGCVRFETGHIQPRPVPTLPLYILNTGQPQSSTGDCVNAVADHFADTDLAGQFTAVVNQIDQALSTQNLPELIKGIQHNHRLLVQIGVVPTAVQQLIAAFEAAGAAAKICGAGSIAGDAAGIVLVVGGADIHTVAKRFGYTLEAVQCDLQGVRVVAP